VLAGRQLPGGVPGLGFRVGALALTCWLAGSSRAGNLCRDEDFVPSLSARMCSSDILKAGEVEDEDARVGDDEGGVCRVEALTLVASPGVDALRLFGQGKTLLERNGCERRKLPTRWERKGRYKELVPVVRSI